MNEKMRELTENLPNQISEALDIASKSKLTPAKGIRNIVVSGLGGSGIGATIVSNWIFDSCKLPVTINKGYFLPNFVKKNTLVICSSYSGNTEETIHVLEQATWFLVLWERANMASMRAVGRQSPSPG